jgi:UDP-N-acetylmuramate dehydrogenase
LDIGYIAGRLGSITGEERIKLNELMKNHTSFRVGGPADILVCPDSIVRLAEIVKECRKNNVPFYIMGNGTNLVVTDKGIRGVVIKTCGSLCGVRVEGDTIQADCGALLSKVAKAALEHSLAGLEFASGIPGTVGGAVCMNAGAYGREIKDVVVRTEYLDAENEIKVMSREQHEFSYRSSRIQKEGGIVLRTVIKLDKGEHQAIKSLMDDLNRRRKDKQPLELPSAGSVFRRPEGYYAGKLIEDCGLKGFSIGGAQVSEKHCGFIVNRGNAAAADIIELVNHIKDCVQSKYGIRLKTEIKILGEE